MNRTLVFCLLVALTFGEAMADEGGLSAVVTNLTTGEPVPGAVVFAMPTKGIASAKTAPVTVDQVDKEFVPHVTVVPVNTPVFFPNSDDIRHHVYSLSETKRFELPLYSGVPANPVVFDKPGPVALGCNIHDWMAAYIYVTETPYYAFSGKDGVARIDLPAGSYLLSVWHPLTRGDGSRSAVTVNAGDPPVAFNVKLRRVFGPVRAPTPGGGGYR